MGEIYDGFEGNSLSSIWNQTKLAPGAIEIQSKIVRKGKQALKITIHKGDRSEKPEGCKTTERDELVEKKELGPKEGKGYSYSFSMYLPKDFPIVPTRLVLAQWKQEDKEDKASITNPVLALRYQYGEFRVTLQTTEEKVTLFRTKEEMRGKWFDFVFKVKFTRAESGFVMAWINKKKIVNFKGITAYSEKHGYPKPGTFYFKMGIYRDKMDKPMTVYLDEYRKSALSN